MNGDLRLPPWPLLAAFLAAGCVHTEGPAAAPTPTSTRAPAGARPQPTPVAKRPATAAGPAPEAPPSRPVLLVTDPRSMTWLEGHGFAFGARVLGKEGEALAGHANHPYMGAIRAAIAGDLARVSEADPRAGVGMRHAHRLFDLRWLSSPHTRLSLVGVVNRLDRIPQSAGRCGELRLIYRLAYSTERGDRVLSSRLPMTVNVVYFQRATASDGPCVAEAKRWMLPARHAGEALAAALAAPGGPLAHLDSAALKSVEINLQSERWPSTMRPDMAGHAGYLLRVFHPKDGSLVPATLENTPDVGRLRADPGALAALLAWLRDPAHLRGLDDATALLPERFLAGSTQSVTPLGLGRLANRPFSQLFSPDDFAELDLAGTRHVRSPRALLRRLDGMSCGGCHQSRSVAGFHLLGEEPPTRTLDAIALPSSPHLDGELVRRAAYLSAIAGGEVGDPGRALSDHEHASGAYGSHCGLGDPGLDSLRCADGHACRGLGDPEVGSCLPEGPPGAGAPCEVGRLRQHRDPHRDRVRGHVDADCGADAVCNDSRVGFPHGSCASACGDRPGEACGLIPALTPFNNCVARGEAFDECVLSTARPAAMRACDRDHPCRDDYICARAPRAAGVCLPPYFLFQLRVDGHVL